MGSSGSLINPEVFTEFVVYVPPRAQTVQCGYCILMLGPSEGLNMSEVFTEFAFGVPMQVSKNPEVYTEFPI